MANGGVVVGGVYCSSGCGYGVGDCLWLQQGRLRSLSREARDPSRAAVSDARE